MLRHGTTIEHQRLIRVPCPESRTRIPNPESRLFRVLIRLTRAYWVKYPVARG